MRQRTTMTCEPIFMVSEIYVIMTIQYGDNCTSQKRA